MRTTHLSVVQLPMPLPRYGWEAYKRQRYEEEERALNTPPILAVEHRPDYAFSLGPVELDIIFWE